MDKKEFRQGMLEMVNEFNNPEGNVNNFIVEGKLMADEFKEHDPVLAKKFGTVFISLDDLKGYVKGRLEK